jgi:Reverse transcriptase (RNA-dependent DNA polymerase)
MLAARVFRALIVIYAYFNLEINQYDAISTFTNSDIDELVFCYATPGYPIEGKILKLLKALYGLKRAPIFWFNDLTKTLEKLGFHMIPNALYVWTNRILIMFFFVNNIAIINCKKDQAFTIEFAKKLSTIYPLTAKNEMKWFLGIRITRDKTARKI